MSKEYTICGVSDIVKIPADKLPVFFADFSKWLEMAREADAISKKLSRELAGEDAGIMFETTSFTWVDDGETGVSGVRIVDLDGSLIATAKR